MRFDRQQRTTLQLYIQSVMCGTQTMLKEISENFGDGFESVTTIQEVSWVHLELNYPIGVYMDFCWRNRMATEWWFLICKRMIRNLLQQAFQLHPTFKSEIKYSSLKVKVLVEVYLQNRITAFMNTFKPPLNNTSIFARLNDCYCS